MLSEAREFWPACRCPCPCRSFSVVIPFLSLFFSSSSVVLLLLLFLPLFCSYYTSSVAIILQFSCCCCCSVVLLLLLLLLFLAFFCCPFAALLLLLFLTFFSCSSSSVFLFPLASPSSVSSHPLSASAPFTLMLPVSSLPCRFPLPLPLSNALPCRFNAPVIPIPLSLPLLYHSPSLISSFLWGRFSPVAVMPLSSFWRHRIKK